MIWVFGAFTLLMIVYVLLTAIWLERAADEAIKRLPPPNSNTLPGHKIEQIRQQNKLDNKRNSAKMGVVLPFKYKTLRGKDEK